MGCNTCGTVDKDGSVKGCRNNGGCQTGGCNKMNVFDWLSNMELPVQDRFDIAEVRFKGGRKEFFRNVNGLDLTTGDAVVVDVPNGHHIGYISLQGELVRLQMQKRKIQNNDDIRAIYRIATLKDMEKFEEVQNRELPSLFRTREIIRDLKLEMKLSDVEFQADNTKATFYYSADERVDFRELIKILAGEFKIRVEMRQISLRQEAGRLGGIGSCGRELCCSTWLTDFKSVSTSAARYQNLSLNPSKLSGQCGRLKCCLNYELETYMDALEDIPEIKGPLKTEKGEANWQKTDIFRKIMWFGYENENNWHAIPVSRVVEIIEQNKRGQAPQTLDEDAIEVEAAFSLNNDLEQLDKKFSQKQGKKKKGRGGKNRKNRPGGGNKGNQPNPQNQMKGKSGSGNNKKFRKNKNRRNNQKGNNNSQQS